MLLLPAILKSYRPKVDKSFSVTFDTRELNPNELLEINSMMNTECFLAIKDNPIEQAEQDILKDLKTEFKNAKTPSQRLRSVLFVLWNQENTGYAEFKDYYDHKINEIIEHFKTQLI